MTEIITNMETADQPWQDRITKLTEALIISDGGNVSIRHNGLTRAAAIGSKTIATFHSTLSDWQIAAIEDLVEANRVVFRHYDMRLEAENALDLMKSRVYEEVEALWEGHNSHMNIEDINAACERMGIDQLEQEFEFDVEYKVRRNATVRIMAHNLDNAESQVPETLRNESLNYGEELDEEDIQIERSY